MSVETLRLAIDRANGQTALARALSHHGRVLTQGHVQKWLRSPNPDKMPPAEYCPAIERVTGVPCETLRPDIDWAVLRGVCKCEAEKAA